MTTEAANLRGQVNDLSAQLAAATKRADTAEAEKASLRQQLAQLQSAYEALRQRVPVPGGQPTMLSEARAPVPTEPLASPASMLAELQKRYVQDLESLTQRPPEDEAGRRKLVEAIERWCKLTTRNLRGRTTWIVRIGDIRRDPAIAAGTGSITALYRVIDQPTGLPIGEPFRADLPSRLTERVERALRLAKPGEPVLWRAQVRFAAAPKYAPDRSDPGPYDEPPLVGPYVEYGAELEFVGLAALETTQTPAPSAPAAPSANPAPPPPAGTTPPR